MGWHTVRGHRYYYENKRIGDRVVSVYRGGGEFGQLCEALATLEREARDGRRAERAEEEDRLRAEDRRTAAVCRCVDALAAAALESAGWHRPQRGKWRRRRRMRAKAAATDLVTTPAPLPEPEFKALVDRATRGDAGATRDLCLAYRAEPRRVLRAVNADVAALVEQLAVKVFDCDDKRGATGLVMREHLASLRAELAGPAPTALERLLAERIALCWFDVHIHDCLRYSAVDHGMKLRLFNDRLSNSAHRRYVSALVALAAVRRAAAPLVIRNATTTTSTSLTVAALAGSEG